MGARAGHRLARWSWKYSRPSGNPRRARWPRWRGDCRAGGTPERPCSRSSSGSTPRASCRRRKEAGVFRYSATQPREQVLSRLIARFVENFLDGSPAPFVAYLTEARNITPEQRAVLEAIVRDLEKKEGKR